MALAVLIKGRIERRWAVNLRDRLVCGFYIRAEICRTISSDSSLTGCLALHRNGAPPQVSYQFCDGDFSIISMYWVMTLPNHTRQQVKDSERIFVSVLNI